MIGPPNPLEAIVTMTAERWRIELLGDVRIRYRDGAWLPLSYQKPVALLLYLAAYPQRPHPREALIDLLWPESDPEAGRLSLRAALHALRRLLESAGAAADDLLLAERATLRLDPAAFTSDLGEYLAAVSAAAGARTPVERSQTLGRAAGYSGEFLPGCNDAWAFEERERLATTQREVLQRLVRVREELGEGEGALSAAREMVALDPLWEEAHYDVMRLYAALGQPQAVLRQYQELSRVLSEELGETPSAEARALAEELRRNARTLVVARRPVAADWQGTRPLPPPLPETAPLRPVAADLPPSPADGPRAGNVTAGSAAETRGAARIEVAGKLPVAWTRFYGRQEEIARLTELLSSGSGLAGDWQRASRPGVGVRTPPSASTIRLLTVTGPGGSGKTRLAVAAVERLAEAPLAADPEAGCRLPAGSSPFPKSVVFVPLADVTDAARIPEAIADALSLKRSPEVEVMEQVITHFAARPWLLVLDNYEHLVEEGALWVRTLLTRVPTLTCLVTSRQRLGITGEKELALLPLPTPRRGTALDQIGEYASVQLFADRARAVKSDFALSMENGASVGELCDRLDGLPLALELAAARIALLSPREMLGQLEGRFAFLVTRQRDTPARHRTLLAVIEGSYQLLSSELQRFFAQLSVFRGGWTLEAAQAVCDEPQALDYLEQLRDCSLLTVEATEGRGRYRLLETLREFAAEQVAPEVRSDLARRHAAFFLALAEKAASFLESDARALWLDRLEREQDNLRAVLRWSLEREPEPPSAAASHAERLEIGLRLGTALVGLWLTRGPVAEGRAHLEGLLTAAKRLPSPRAMAGPASRLEGVLARALWLSGRLAVHHGDYEAAGRRCAEALEAARSLADPSLVASCLLQLAEWAQRQRDLPAARRHLDAALTICRQIDDREKIAFSLALLGDLACDERDPEQAWLLYEESRATQDELGDQRAVGWLLCRMGGLVLRHGDLERAHALYDEAARRFREVADQVGSATVLCLKSEVALGQGDPAAARDLAEESLRLRREFGNPRDIAWSLDLVARTALASGDFLAARPHLEERLAIVRELEGPEALMHALGAMGHLERDMGAYRRARSWYEESLRVRCKLGDQIALAQSLEDFAVLAGREQHSERAIRLLGAAESLCVTLGARPPVAVVKEYERTVAEGRAALGEQAFADTWAEGRALSLDQAIAFALETSEA